MLPALPLLPSGKVDRAALPGARVGPSGGAADARAAHLDGRDPARHLARAARRRPVRRRRQLLRPRRPLAAGDPGGLARSPSCSTSSCRCASSSSGRPSPALAEHSTSVRRASAGLAAPPLAPVPRGGALRLVVRAAAALVPQPARRRPARPTTCRPRSRIEGGARRPPARAHASRRSMRRHEVLRSRFVVQDGAPVHGHRSRAALHAAGRGPPRRLTPTSSDARGRGARRRGVRAAVRSRAPGRWCGRGCSCSATSSHVLLLTTHHIVSDGWSTALLMDDLVRDLRRRSARSAVAAARRCACSTPTSPTGSAAGWPGRCSTRRSPTGSASSTAPRRSSQLPTDRPRPAVQTLQRRDQHLRARRRPDRRDQAPERSAPARRRS